jgi:glycosyltransferase involved in cell wall biosynthesis
MMDVFLLASYGEGLPNVLLEAQWAGTPVVATDVGGARETVEPGGTGWMIPGDSAADMAGVIKWLYEHPEILEIARKRAPQWVREQFGVEHMLDQTLKTYALSPLPPREGADPH